MNFRNSEIKLLFIAQSLNKYADEVSSEMRRRIVQTKSVDTRHLLNSMMHRTYQQQAEGTLALSFAQWGRFLDMGVRRGHPLGGIKATEEALKGKSKNIKPRKIYSPVAYGKLNWLMGELAHGFTEETINQLKTQLNASAQNT